MPRKIRDLVKDLIDVGFTIVPGGGKRAYRKFTHPRYPGAATLSGQGGDDARKYQERQVKHEYWIGKSDGLFLAIARVLPGGEEFDPHAEFGISEMLAVLVGREIAQTHEFFMHLSQDSLL